MTMYPGYNTQFYVVLQQVVTGPITGLEDLSTYNIEPDTPVWYEGLDDWKPAILAPLTNQLFTPDSEFYRYKAARQAAVDNIPDIPTAEEVIPEIPTEKTPAEEYIPDIPAEDIPPVTVVEPAAEEPAEPTSKSKRTRHAHTQAVAAEVEVKKPSAYLVWAIVVTAVFSLVCGVIAIIYACKVNSKFKKGNYEGAERCSERVQWWVAIGICVGLVTAVFRVFFGSMLPF